MDYKTEHLADYFLSVGVTPDDIAVPERALQKVMEDASYSQGMHPKHLDAMEAVNTLSQHTGQRRQELEALRQQEIIQQQEIKNAESVNLQRQWAERGQA